MRKNTVTWVDGKVLTNLMGELQAGLMSLNQPLAPEVNDLHVLIAAINLRDRLNQIVERSAEANKK